MPELVQFLEFENNGLVSTDIPNNMLGTDFLSTTMENSELFGCKTFQLTVSCKKKKKTLKNACIIITKVIPFLANSIT